MRASLLLLTLLVSSCTAKSRLTSTELTKKSTSEIYQHLIDDPQDFSPAALEVLEQRWTTAQVPFVLGLRRFSKASELTPLFNLLMKKTGHKGAFDYREIDSWLWKQDYKPLAGYPTFKKQLYRQIDPKFAAYFEEKYANTIRLDQVVWGGVRQDGIPPLHNPKMLAAGKAGYLSANDVVFGIEVNGETRAYPKRILAWHEMFTDTIQGVPLAGVY